VDDGPVNDALETGRGRGFGDRLSRNRRKLGVQIFCDPRAKAVDIDVASSHDRRSVPVFYESGKQVLQRRILMVSLVGLLERAMKGDLQILREGRHC
jgi:hypothetical protein